MLNGWVKNDRSGSGMVVWTGREMYAKGEINEEEFIDYVASGYVYTCALYSGSCFTANI